MTATAIRDSSLWADRASARLILFCAQCAKSPCHHHFCHRACREHPQKTQRQAGTREQKSGEDGTDGSEPTAAHQELHGAAAGKPSRMIAGKALGVTLAARGIEHAAQFLPR